MRIPFLKIIFSIFLSLSLLPQAIASSSRNPEPIKLKILLLPFLSFAPLFISEEEGFFAEQGLQIEFVRMSSSEAAIPALARGDLDITGGNLRISSLNAMAREGKMKFVADKGYVSPTGCPYYAFIARRTIVEAEELKTAKQLKGRRISLAHGMATSEGYFVEKLLNTGGLTIGDVEIVQVPASAQSDAMHKGSIDLAVGGEPWVTQMLQSGHGVLWMAVQQIIPGFQHDTIVYGPNLLHKNLEAGRKFLLAYLKGVRHYNQGKTERNLKIISKYTGLDQEVLKKNCWTALRNDGQITIGSVMDFQSWAVKKGFLDREVPPNQFWDPSFVEYANKVLSSAVK